MINAEIQQMKTLEAHFKLASPHVPTTFFLQVLCASFLHKIEFGSGHSMGLITDNPAKKSEMSY